MIQNLCTDTPDGNPQPMATMADPWDFCDKVYCISLTDRADRRASARQAFARVDLGERVEFFLATRHPQDCEQGIFESHQRCLRRGLEAGAAWIAVFEDDVVFRHFDPQRLARAAAFVKRQPGQPMLFFGCLVRRSRPAAEPGLRRIRYASLTHGYALGRELAARIAEAPWQGAPYDMLLRRMVGEAYAIDPAFAFQSDAPSDNTRHRLLDRFRRICGGLAFIQAMNERYHRHRTAIVVLHALVLLAAILVLLT
jgi:hypothetical protein